MSYYYKEFSYDLSTEKVEKTSERKNLLAGLPVYGVESFAPIAERQQTDYFNTPEDKFTLTDGVTHAEPEYDYMDPAFTHFTFGTGRAIIYKLPCVCAVDEFNFNFLNQRDVGIGYPYNIAVFVSEDGKAWQRVFFLAAAKASSPKEMRLIGGKLEKPIKALFIRFEFEHSLHTWIESVAAYGTTKIPCRTPSPVDDGIIAARANEGVGKYPAYSDLCDVHNIALAYHCFPPEFDDVNHNTSFDKKNILPYLAYLDREGNIKDTFYDSLLFLPFSRFTYSVHYKTAEGWKFYVDNVFEEHKNVDAADEVADDIEKALGIKCEPKIFLSILHTNVTYGDLADKFGALDDEGDIDIKSYEGRKKAVKWVIDEQISRFNAKERKHVKLVGFYWFEEALNFADEFDIDLIHFARDYLHEKGLKLIWIPYYQAPGYNKWKEAGFDVACMQPNYAFSKEAQKQRLYDNADLCLKYGLCYELELNSVANDYDVNKFKDYLDAGVEAGFMKTIKMYYEGGRGIKNACESKDDFARSVYDDTYLFAKEKLVKAVRKE